jgi:hypothetical protein
MLARRQRGSAGGLWQSRSQKDARGNVQYQFLPLLRKPTLVLGYFLSNAFTSKATGEGKFRILEIGAGTEGTTMYIVNHLKSMGIDFEYVY